MEKHVLSLSRARMDSRDYYPEKEALNFEEGGPQPRNILGDVIV